MESFNNALIFLYQKILDLLYPKQCIICGKIGKEIVCNKCFNNIKTNVKIEKYEDKSFNEHLYIFKYEGTIRNKIIDYKFNDKAYLNEFFVKFILKNEKICRKIKSMI